MDKKKPDKLSSTPPKWASRFLEWYCAPELLDEIEGDLYEAFFIRVKKYGQRKAQLLYIKEVLLFCKPSSFEKSKSTIMPSLFGNYCKIAARNLFKQKGYSLINIAGLTIALSVTLLMLLWVQDEWSTDKFHSNSDRLFLLKRTIPLDAGKVDIYRGVPYPLLMAAQNELPEVEKFIPLGQSSEMTLKRGKQIFRTQGTFANVGYFESFSFPILAGDISELGEKKEAIAISETLANKFFGNIWQSTAIGETITISNVGDFLVTAVYKDFPPNSSIQQDFIYTIDNFIKRNNWVLDWGNSGMQGALLLAEGANPTDVAQKIEKLYLAKQQGTFKEGCILQKFGDGYLYGQFDDQANVIGGRIEYVQMFSIAALLLLIISCINFVNLATARASKRAKEVGVRKTIGAGKNSLITQFMVEAGLITVISVGLGIFLAQKALPNVQLITEKMLHFDYSSPMFWASIFIVIILTTLLSGAYPAFVLSSFRPIAVLKGKIPSQSGSIGLRKGLVIIQFVLALLLVVGAFVIKEQVQYIQNKNLGINKDNLMMIEKEELISAKYEALKNELLQAEGIENLTLAGPRSPIDMQASTGGVSWEGKKEEDGHQEFQIFWTEPNFLDVFDITLAEGRFYREGATQDTNSIVLNKKAIEVMGLTDPIGKTIQWWRKPRQIIGVIEDFHNQSLYDEIQPLGILLDPENASSLFVKAKAGEVKTAVASLQSVFNKVVPEVYLHYNFVDTEYQQQYKSEVLTGTLANYFAIISILIACLGLLGLSTFLAEQKSKEIGIRKVLGASIGNLIGLLSKDFLLLVGAGLLIGIPVSWYLLNGWLTNFAYTIELKWWMFAIPVVIAIIIAGLTIGIQAVRAALNNPIDALTSE